MYHIKMSGKDIFYTNESTNPPNIYKNIFKFQFKNIKIEIILYVA